MFKKKVILILLLFSIFLCVSSVSACENSENIANDTNESQENTTSTIIEKNETSIPEKTVNAVAKNNQKKSVILKPSKLSTSYGSGKYLQIKVFDSLTKKPVSNVKIVLKVFTDKKYKTITVTSNSKGIAKYYASFLKIGNHKIVADAKNINAKSVSSSVKISKAKLIISAPKITKYYKENKKFKITIKNKESKIIMKKISVLIKLYTGKKFNKYSLKTNNNGEINLNTKTLSKGLHNVFISVKGTSYVHYASAKSSIKTKNTMKPTQSSQNIKIKANGKTLTVKLENNAATKALVEKLKKGNVIIKANEYGGFEKVGDLGFSLPQSDRYITTSSGDIVLYNGDQLSLFYNSNSWQYTKLGKIQNVSPSELKNILGTGDVTLTLSLK